MPDLVFHRFDEEANIHAQSISISFEELSASKCWLPARFLGGTCDRFYICQYAEKANCKASPSRLAREKAEHGELEEGEEFRKDWVCACCDSPIILEYSDLPYRGDPGTHYEGQPICDTCYDEDLCEPCATVYYGLPDEDDSGPHCIGACRNETESDFTVRWHSTDPWRGYYELESERFTRLFTDAILSMHESEEMLKDLHDRLLERLEEEGIQFARAFCRSSNVFMTCLEIWVEKDLVKLMKAHLILDEIKFRVDFDNPLYKTGILIPRENLERFKRLLGDRYRVETDQDLADIVARRGEELIEEIKAATGGQDDQKRAVR